MQGWTGLSLTQHTHTHTRHTLQHVRVRCAVSACGFAPAPLLLYTFVPAGDESSQAVLFNESSGAAKPSHIFKDTHFFLVHFSFHTVILHIFSLISCVIGGYSHTYWCCIEMSIVSLVLFTLSLKLLFFCFVLFRFYLNSGNTRVACKPWPWTDPASWERLQILLFSFFFKCRYNIELWWQCFPLLWVMH